MVFPYLSLWVVTVFPKESVQLSDVPTSLKNWALEDATYSDLEKIVDLFKFAQDSENMEAALQYLNKTLDKNSFDIEGIPKHDISVKYALAFYENVIEVFEKI